MKNSACSEQKTAGNPKISECDIKKSLLKKDGEWLMSMIEMTNLK